LHGSAGRAERVLDAVLLLFELGLGGRADLDHRDAARQLRKTLLELSRSKSLSVSPTVRDVSRSRGGTTDERAKRSGPIKGGVLDTTGRYLLVLNPAKSSAALKAVRENSGRPVRQVARGAQPVVEERIEPIFFPRFDVAIAELDERQRAILENNSDLIEAIELEPVLYPAMSPDYWRGYRDGVEAAEAHAREATTAIAAAYDESVATWGLQATGVSTSRATGAGIRVAILDTGLDFSHPDFIGRTIVGQSFIRSGTVDDLYQHGTHCAGTICGPQSPVGGRRYGVAPDVELFVGKVCEDDGLATLERIIAGLEWAVEQGCQIASVSLAQRVPPGTGSHETLERVAGIALDRFGLLIIAAVGNDSQRPKLVAPVSLPANTGPIVAVAAIDDRMQLPSFSNGRDGIWKGPDIAAPGVSVYSSWPMPRRYHVVSGTSMAVPHVAGIAALYAEATGARGSALRRMIIDSAHPLVQSASDVGAGLSFAPQ
jgi:subtilisin family serine protease